MGDAPTLEDMLAAPPGTHAYVEYGPPFVRQEDGWWYRAGDGASLNAAAVLQLDVRRLADDG